ncbi:MAG: CO/xanthine dehydrogenase FAD-binding subunit [Paracoccaceae bacterium]|jgi:CO/xanthine dehydrogenase FAD-binding subunit
MMRYVTAQTVDQAVQYLAQEPGLSRILSGGTDLLVQLKAQMIAPDLIVDVKHIPGMRDIELHAGSFRIGAAVSGAELGEHSALCAAWPGLAEGFKLIGSTQVQGRATLAGNLCNASPAADAVPCLVAAGATIRLVGPNGMRDVPAEDISVGPGRTTLLRGEFVEAIFLPARAAGSSDAYQRFTPRSEMDIAVVSAGVNIILGSDKTISTARVALGAVAPTVLLVQACADAILGSRLDDAALDRLDEAASAACNPIDDKRGTIEYRTHVAGVLARRTAQVAFDRAGANL